MIPFMDTGLPVGPLSKRLDGADISFYVGFLVGGIVYSGCRRLAARYDRFSPDPSQAVGSGVSQ